MTSDSRNIHKRKPIIYTPLTGGGERELAPPHSLTYSTVTITPKETYGSKEENKQLPSGADLPQEPPLYAL